jgi:hypothetical protein
LRFFLRATDQLLQSCRPRRIARRRKCATATRKQRRARWDDVGGVEAAGTAEGERAAARPASGRATAGPVRQLVGGRRARRRSGFSFFALIAFSNGKPVSTFPENAQAARGNKKIRAAGAGGRTTSNRISPSTRSYD